MPPDEELELDPDQDALDAEVNESTPAEKATALKPSRPEYHVGVSPRAA